jgi:hypothetical protein
MLALLPQTPQCDEAKIKQMVGDAAVVLIAEVKEEEPTFENQPWTGFAASKQYVRYEVKSVLKGELPDSEVRIGFYLIKNSLTADKSRPQLSPELFKKHNVHIIFLQLDLKPPASDGNPPPPPSYTALDENYGAIIATPDTEAAIRALQSTP